MSHRMRLASALALVLFPLGAAVAQPAGEPVVGRLLPYLRDEKLQRELSLTPEQVKTLIAYRQQLWDDQLNTPPAEFKTGAADRARATREAFRKTLSPEQHDRASQLATRLALRRPARRPVDPTRVEVWHLTAYPELASALALDADQRTLLDSSRASPGVVFLVPRQTAVLEKLLGPPWEPGAEPEFDARDRADDGTKHTRTRVVYLTWSTDVHADLKLTAEQVKALDTIRTTTPAGPGGAKLPIPEAADRRDEQAWQVLTPAQQARLRQIDARQYYALGNPDLFSTRLLNELGVSADRQWAIVAARAAYADAVARSALSGDPAEAVGRAVRTATEARDRAFRAALTPDQQTKLDARFGEPFTGMIGLDPQAREFVRARRAAGFGRYDNELSVLTLNRSVQDELNITPERLKLVREASGRAPRVLPQPTEEAADARSEYVGKTLAALLTPGQQRRLRQIMLQERERPSAEPVSRINDPTAVAYPGVAEAVGLTDAQRASLLDGEDPRDTLTPRQQAAIRAMLGEPFRGSFGTGSDFTRSRTPGPRGAVLMDLPWSAAGLTPAQAGTVARLLNKFQAPAVRPAGGNNPFRNPPAAEPAGSPEALEKAVTAALTPEQAHRLDQLALQMAVGRDPRAILTRLDAARLELTREQVEKLYEVEQEWRKVVRSVPPAQLTRDLFDRLRRRLDDQLLAVLTPGQRATWADLTGEPCPEVRRAMPMFRPSGL